MPDDNPILVALGIAALVVLEAMLLYIICYVTIPQPYPTEIHTLILVICGVSFLKLISRFYRED